MGKFINNNWYVIPVFKAVLVDHVKHHNVSYLLHINYCIVLQHHTAGHHNDTFAMFSVNKRVEQVFFFLKLIVLLLITYLFIVRLLETWINAWPF